MAIAANLLVEKIRDVTIVTFQDNVLLDAASIQAVGNSLYELVDQRDRRRLVLDFSKVRNLSSSMLGVLLTLKEKLDEIDGRVVLVGLSKELKRLFDMTALDRLFQFAPSADEGLGVFGVTTAG